MRATAIVTLAGIVLVTLATGCARPAVQRTEPPPPPYVFGWPFVDAGTMRTRGGTTAGPEVVVDDAPGEAWTRLQAPGLDARERDRRAILAMAGTYRVSFDFLEVMGFRAGFRPGRPYRSWATELILVLRDEPRFVSLQHILVMFVRTPEGMQGPMVTKHWRQDWRYEDRDLLTYRGPHVWARERLPASRVRGTWSQAVFQVDDSPRYESIGRWQHEGGVSTWISERTWRPLPRREFSVRHDYDVLVGTNRHTITPSGWVQEEENLKVDLDARGEPIADRSVLAKEIGLNRYERLRGFDDSAARRYHERTEPLWREVRAAWEDVVASRSRVSLRAAPDQGQLFVPLFEYAERLSAGTPADPADLRDFARAQVDTYLGAP